MKGGTRLLVSRIAVILFVASMLVAIYFDSRYMLGGIIAGIIQIVCGPGAYRWIGILAAGGMFLILAFGKIH